MSEAIRYEEMACNFSRYPSLAAMCGERHVASIFFEPRKVEFLRGIEGVALQHEIHLSDFDNSADLVAEINRVAGRFATVSRYYWLGMAAEMDARAKAKVAAA